MRSGRVSVFCKGKGSTASGACGDSTTSMKRLTMPRAGRPEKARVSRVWSSRADRMAALCASGMPASSLVRKTVPICTAAAPSANAAAMPRPSMMPPDAITGTVTASATCGTSAMVPTRIAAGSPMKLPRCPPASLPWAITASTPARSSATASATVVAVPSTRMPRALAAATLSAGGRPKVTL